MKNQIAKIVSSFILLAFYSVELLAQPGLPNPPDQAPIDGGLSLLAAAGGAYAVKKLRDKKKTQDELQE